MSIAIIPARGGSKRIPRKNIREFCGRPMISWSIQTAQRSDLFEKVFVSTDDDEIARVARSYGAEVPFKRPDELANDFASTKDVVQHFLTWAHDNQIKIDEICCIYPAAPLITSKMLKDSRSLLRSHKECRFVLPVLPYGHPIQRAVSITSKGSIEPIEMDYIKSRTQDITEAYHDAGQFYWGRQSAWADSQPIIGSRSIGYPLKQHSLVDIDNESDWLMAEILFEASQTKFP